MNQRINIAQIILRLALGIGFLRPVMDRIGWLGPAGAGATWGNWANFVAYTHKMMPFLSMSATGVMGLLATVAEVVFGICLIIGFKTRVMALGAGLLTLVFGICMATFMRIGAPFDYPVFVFTGGSLLLSDIPGYKYSVDGLL